MTNGGNLIPGDPLTLNPSIQSSSNTLAIGNVRYDACSVTRPDGKLVRVYGLGLSVEPLVIFTIKEGP